MFQRLFGKPRFRRFADSFTLTGARKLATLCHWTQQQAARGDVVIVLSHFQSSFLENQSALQDAGIEFDIMADTLDEIQFRDRLLSTAAEPQILLSMSQMLQATPDTGSRTNQSRPLNQAKPLPPLSVIVTERYPLITVDEKLERFFQQMDSPVSMGYLIAFDDPILVHLLGQRFVNLLKQLGLGDQDLVSSTMTYRGLSRKLQHATSRVQQERPAISPEAWIQQNLDDSTAP